MTIASEITQSQTNLVNSYTACQNKGATMPASQNFDNLATCIASISSGGEYQLQRIVDDNNNEIGTAFMEFADANNNKYKVVCLDAQYRVKGSYYFCSSMTAITNMPITDDITNGFWGTLPYTATENTQLILDYCTANNYTSTACTHCRSLSFTIGGTTYYGQFPNMIEVVEMWKRPSAIESMDTSASSYTDVNFSTKRNMIVSTQSTAQNCWLFGVTGSISEVPKSLTGQLVIPVLEIPVS